jgi:hypothetical protein
MSNKHLISDSYKPLLGDCEATLAQLPDEKREHFLYVIHALMDCYKSEENKAIVLISEGLDDPTRISLIAINSDAEETDGLIETLGVFRQIDSKVAAHSMN